MLLRLHDRLRTAERSAGWAVRVSASVAARSAERLEQAAVHLIDRGGGRVCAWCGLRCAPAEAINVLHDEREVRVGREPLEHVGYGEH